MPTTIMVANMLGFSKIATGTPAAFAREVEGGGFQYNTNQIVKSGIGGQRGVRKGLSEVRTTVQAAGVAVADWSLWLPGELTVEVAAFPDALAEIDDGTLGKEWVLSGGQPARFGFEWSDAADSEALFTLESMYALATAAAVGTAAPVYYGSTDAFALGYGPGDVGLTLGDADYGVIGINYAVDLGAIAHNTATVRAAAAKTFPEAIFLTKFEPTLELITTEPIMLAELTADEYTAGTAVLTLDNGTEADDATITQSSLITTEFNLPWEGEGRVGFRHSFILGTCADPWATCAVT